MADLFRDTLAGQIIRALTRGRICGLSERSATASTDKLPTDRADSGPHVSTSELENGKDFELVSWYSLDDPEVTSSCFA